MKKTFFNHDSSARNDIRVIKLRAKLGYAGYGVFWALLELLFTEENKLCIDDYDTLAFGLQCDPKILKKVIEDFDLFVIEDGCFYSKRLNKQIETINDKSKKAKENAKKRWGNADAEPLHTKRNASISISKAKAKENKSKINDINLRLETFQKKVLDIEDIDVKDKTAFIDYWTEKNQSGTRMRFEMEKTWDLSRRIKRWVNSDFNKSQNKFPDYYDDSFNRKIDDSTRKDYHNHLKSLGFVSKYSPNAGTKWIKK
tara:strand:- start:2867 stop:3634 length:768 start_codon:yes stop_codon:yes gene_type:complete